MADSKYTVAFTAIEQRLANSVPAALAGGVSYPGRALASVTNQPWSRLSFIPTASTNVATGGGQTWKRRNGLIVVDVFTPKGSGVDINLLICEEITTLFENTEFGNVKTFEANTAKIEDDPWTGYQVTINFYCEGL